MTSTSVAPTNAAAAQYTSPTSGASGAAGTSSASAGALSINNGLASLAGNFQSFLSLLTTQLQNQDPLNPTDTNQFTQQITSMTGVEQQLMSNQLLQQLVAQQTGIGAAAGLMGDTVTAPGATSSDPAITGDGHRRQPGERSDHADGRRQPGAVLLDHQRDRNLQSPRLPAGRLTDTDSK